MRPYLGIATQQLKNLFDFLKGDPDLTSPPQITSEARKEITTVCEHIEQFQADRRQVNVPVRLFVYPTAPYPSALIRQLAPELLYLEWIFLPGTPEKTITPFMDQCATLVKKG